MVFDEFESEGLPESKIGQIEKVGDIEQDQPNAIGFLPQIFIEQRSEHKHGGHIQPEQSIGTAKLVNKLLLPGKLPLDF